MSEPPSRTLVISASNPPTPVYRAITLRPGQGRILIERWTLSDEPRLRNIARRDAGDKLIWRAKLPETSGRECFVAMRLVGDAVLATTYQGAQVLLDVATGEHLTWPVAGGTT